MSFSLIEALKIIIDMKTALVIETFFNQEVVIMEGSLKFSYNEILKYLDRIKRVY